MLTEAAGLGVLQLHLSGGEPLLRRDLVEIVHSASGLGLYTNLITSGFGLSSRRAELLRAAGLDHVQISIQADDPALADRIAGTPSFERKRAAAKLVRKLGWPLTVNVVLHRHNIDRVGRILDMAADLEADRVELANTQYYGWAWRNRDGLLPSRAQLERAEATVRAARSRLDGRMEIIYVVPDYFSRYPKPCMGGWGRRQLTVGPDGDVLPCPTAHDLPLPRASVREHSLAWIWERSPLFQRFRGIGIFDGVAPLAGILLGHDVSRKIGGDIADSAGSAALGLYGLYLIVRAMQTATQEELEAERRWSIFGLPVPLSLDNVIAGAALGIIGMSPLIPAILFGVITVLMTLIGLQLGLVASRIIPVRPRWDFVVGVALVIEAFIIAFWLLPNR